MSANCTWYLINVVPSIVETHIAHDLEMLCEQSLHPFAISSGGFAVVEFLVAYLRWRDNFGSASSLSRRLQHRTFIGKDGISRESGVLFSRDDAVSLQAFIRSENEGQLRLWSALSTSRFGWLVSFILIITMY